MIVMQKPQTIGPAILPLLGERAGVRVSKKTNSLCLFISRIPFPPQTLALAGPPRYAVLILNQSLIKIENGLMPPLSQACYKPKIRPKNKGIKPNASRCKPKNIWSFHAGVLFCPILSFCQKLWGHLRLHQILTDSTNWHPKK